jgi:hypothetical protein
MRNEIKRCTLKYSIIDLKFSPDTSGINFGIPVDPDVATGAATFTASKQLVIPALASPFPEVTTIFKLPNIISEMNRTVPLLQDRTTYGGIAHLPREVEVILRPLDGWMDGWVGGWADVFEV